METSLKIVLCLTWLSLLGTIAQKNEDLTLSTYLHQEKRLISATVGDNVTLQCFHKGSNSGWIFWYKQSLGQMPRLMATIYVFSVESTFYNEFNNMRFTLEYKDNTCQLAISDLRVLDSATYFCASSHTHTLTFAEGITVIVQGSALNLQALVHHERLQPRGSKTLSCMLHTGSCDREHHVYWLQSSEETHSGFIYTKGDRCDQRERNHDTKTNICGHSFAQNTHDCAVLSCGHILHGNGSKLDNKYAGRFIQVCVLSGTLTVSTILTVLLALSLYKMTKKEKCQCSDSQARSSTRSTTNPEDNQDTEDLHYAAVNVNPLNRTRLPRKNSVECVYSSLKQ